MRLPFPLPKSWRAAPSGTAPGIGPGPFSDTDAPAAPIAQPLPGDPDAWIACEHCDALHRNEIIALDEEARCTRCGVKLYRNQSERLSVLLPLVVTGLIVYVVANAFPIAEMEAPGTTHATTLWQAVLALFDNDMVFAGVLVGLTTVLFPLLYLAVLTPLLIARLRGRTVPRAALMLRVAAMVRPWAMIEIFLLGAIVALIKIAHTVPLAADTGLWAFAVLTVFMTVTLSIDLRPFWREGGMALPLPAGATPDAAADAANNAAHNGANPARP